MPDSYTVVYFKKVNGKKVKEMCIVSAASPTDARTIAKTRKGHDITIANVKKNT